MLSLIASIVVLPPCFVTLPPAPAPQEAVEEAAQAEAEPAEVPADLSPSIARAVDVLLGLQEDMDGGDSNVEWPYEGVYRVRGEIPVGYRVGGTSISIWALAQTPQYEDNEELREAIERGVGFVLTTLDEELMSSSFLNSYDVRGWGHTYALQMLLTLKRLDRLPKKHKRDAEKRIAWLVQTLEDTEIPENGGWNYARRKGGKSPDNAASPFMTAPTLLALYDAREQGFKVDDGVVLRAIDVLDGARAEERFYPYTSRGGRDTLPGAIGRTPVTEVALHLAGRGDATRLQHSLDDFLEHWDELEVRRRQNGTHIPPHGVAPYYFMYAHLYAALAIEYLPEDVRPDYRQRFLERVFQVQEESGGWNDRVFPRSENYGTATILLALNMPQLSKPVEWTGKRATKEDE